MSLVLTHRFPAEPRAVARARVQLRGWLEAIAVSSGDARDIELVFSELAGNAVKAAQRVGSSEDIELVARCEEVDLVVIEVQGPGDHLRPDRLRGVFPGDQAETGRGLAIAAALTDRLEAERRDGSTLVRAVRSLHSGPPSGRLAGAC